jgi:hypothetical protein
LGGRRRSAGRSSTSKPSEQLRIDDSRASAERHIPLFRRAQCVK